MSCVTYVVGNLQNLPGSLLELLLPVGILLSRRVNVLCVMSYTLWIPSCSHRAHQSSSLPGTRTMRLPRRRSRPTRLDQLRCFPTCFVRVRSGCSAFAISLFRGESGREWGQKSALKVATVDRGCSFFIQRSRIVLSFFAVEGGSVFRHFVFILSKALNCISSTCSTHTSGGSSKHQPTPPSTKQKPFWFTHFHPLRPNYAQIFLRSPS